jgi:predicted O-methyltransferase YrrM
MNLSSGSEALDWELGSKGDPIRNNFVVPHLVNLFNRTKPDTILDVGAATGYIARQVDVQLSYRANWTLVDQNEARVALAHKLKPVDMRASVLFCDFLSIYISRSSLE